MLIGWVSAVTMLLLAGTSALLHIYIPMGLFLWRPRENRTSQNLFATKLRSPVTQEARLAVRKICTRVFCVFRLVILGRIGWNGQAGVGWGQSVMLGHPSPRHLHVLVISRSFWPIGALSRDSHANDLTNQHSEDTRWPYKSQQAPLQH